MKKIFIMLIIVMLTMVLTACGAGGSGGDSGGGAYDEAKSAGYDGFGNFFAADTESTEEYMPEEPAAAAEDSGKGIGISLPASINKENVKLIFTADMYVQTTDFGEAEKGLYGLVEKFGGYFEYISADNGNYYSSDDSYKYSRYTVRVPSDNFQPFINSVSEGMHVVNMSQNAQDVGQEYFDTERRLETLKNKHDRLEALLAKAENMTDIIELEGALSDTEYEIEQFTSDLQRYDSLISYSTVTIGIEKVNDYTPGISDELTFGQRLLKSIKQGAKDFGYGIGCFIEWIGYHVIQLAILAAVIVILVKAHVISGIKNLFRKKKTNDYVIVSKNDGSGSEK